MYSLVMGFKDNYKKFGYTTLFSFLKNNPNKKVIVYILSDDLDFSYFASLEKTFPCTIVPIKVSPEIIKTVDCGYLSFGTLIRLLISEYLPVEVTKVLYLDADLIINGPVDELWAQDITPYYAAVVGSSAPKAHLKAIGVDKDCYFNAGVMLFNLTLCREHNVLSRCLELVKNNDFLFLDQDALNIVMSKNVKFLDAKWNFDSYRAKTILLNNKISELYKNIVIYHFTGRDKPWMQYCFNQFKPIYLKYYSHALGFSVEKDLSIYNGIRFYAINFLYRNRLTSKIIFHIRNIIRTNIQ